MKLSIIIVTYNSENVIKDCIDSIYNTVDNFEFEVIIVDNNSQDRTVELIRTDHPNINFLQNSDNKGFAAAVNQGIKQSSGDLVLLLNPDVVLEKNTINKSVEHYLKTKNIGALGIKLLNTDKSLQNTFGNFPSLVSEGIYALFLHKVLPFGHLIINKSKYNTPKKVDWVGGAYLLTSKKVIEKAGMLDEDYFMYVEDIDWCYRMKKAGFVNYYYPLVSATHSLGASFKTEKTNKNIAKVIYLEAKNTVLFAKKHLTGFHVMKFKYFYKIRMFVQFLRWKKKGNKAEAGEFLQALRMFRDKV